MPTKTVRCSSITLPCKCGLGPERLSGVGLRWWRPHQALSRAFEPQADAGWPPPLASPVSFRRATQTYKAGSIICLYASRLGGVNQCPSRHFELQPGLSGLNGFGAVLDARVSLCEARFIVVEGGMCAGGYILFIKTPLVRQHLPPYQFPERACFRLFPSYQKRPF